MYVIPVTHPVLQDSTVAALNIISCEIDTCMYLFSIFILDSHAADEISFFGHETVFPGRCMHGVGPIQFRMREIRLSDRTEFVGV